MVALAVHSNVFYRAIDYWLRLALRAAPATPFFERIALWWGYRFRPPEGIVRLRSGALISLSDVEHSQLLMRYLGTFEPHCLAYLKKFAKPGAVVLDVGANIGLYTVEASRAVGPTGRVISIEAAPSHAKSIERSVQLNGMRNVSLVNSAVGDECGEALLTLPSGGNLGMFTLGEVAGDNAFKVQVRRIDDIMADLAIAKVDLIKMDIEGSEYRALCGARQTLAKYHPTILIELNESALRACGSSANEVKELLSSFGYRGFLIGRKSLQPLGHHHICDECLFY